MDAVLDEATWRARAEAHAARVDAFVAPHLERRSGGVKHPVHDFLFTYYAQRPAQLRRWHPGYGVGLAGGAAYEGLKGYGWFRDGCFATSSTTGPVVEEGALAPVSAVVEEGALAPVSPVVEEGALAPVSPVVEEGALAPVSKPPTQHTGVVAVTAAHVARQRPLLESLHRLLSATAARPAQLGCFGLHEWAMVYRMTEEQTRHADWPLRLGPDGTDAVVESHRIGCSHFDAFRFFTEPARPLNVLAPTSENRPDLEQPGCLHAGMDLYKHAFRLTPMISSDLVADCFELARDIRVLDMRAAPYDLADLGFDPVRIETAEGKQEYAAAQRGFAERGAPLRARLVAECERLLAAA